MFNETTKKVIWYQKDNEIIVTEECPDGNVEGELIINCTPLGYQLRVYDDSWKIFGKCEDIFKLLSEVSIDYLPIEILAYKIFNIGYELEIVY